MDAALVAVPTAETLAAQVVGAAVVVGRSPGRGRRGRRPTPPDERVVFCRSRLPRAARRAPPSRQIASRGRSRAAPSARRSQQTKARRASHRRPCARSALSRSGTRAPGRAAGVRHPCRSACDRWIKGQAARCARDVEEADGGRRACVLPGVPGSSPRWTSSALRRRGRGRCRPGSRPRPLAGGQGAAPPMWPVSSPGRQGPRRRLGNGMGSRRRRATQSGDAAAVSPARGGTRRQPNDAPGPRHAAPPASSARRPTLASPEPTPADRRRRAADRSTAPAASPRRRASRVRTDDPGPRTIPTRARLSKPDAPQRLRLPSARRGATRPTAPAPQ